MAAPPPSPPAAPAPARDEATDELKAAGPAADNLTLIAMRWGAPDPDTVTRDMSLGVPADRALVPISDEEMELAVAEIRRRIPFTPNSVPMADRIFRQKQLNSTFVAMG